MQRQSGDDRKLSQAYSLRALAYFYGADYQAALKDYGEALRLDPLNATCYRDRGKALLHLNRRDEALADFDEAIRLDPQEAQARAERGELYKEMGMLEESIRDFDHVINVVTDRNFYLAWTYLLRAECYMEQEKWHPALADLNQLIDKFVDLQEEFPMALAHRKRATCNEVLGDHESAERDLDHADCLRKEWIPRLFGPRIEDIDSSSN